MGAERNYARFYCLLKRLPGADKETLVEQFTNGRTVHLHETTEREYHIMCDQMERVAGYDERKAAWRAEVRKKRSVCLKLMQCLGVNTTDWPTVDNFCLNPRVAGKSFARLSIEELDALQRKLRAIERHGGLKKTSSSSASPNLSEGRGASQGRGALIVFPMYNIKEN
jgi:hypothetical protein